MHGFDGADDGDDGGRRHEQRLLLLLLLRQVDRLLLEGRLRLSETEI